MSSQKKLPILCLDFDGVLHGYQSGWQGAAIIPDPPVPGAVEFLHSAVERFQVAIYSSRSGRPGGIDAMRGWLTMWLLAVIEDRREAEHVLSLIQWPTEKPAAIVTIDDRAIQFTGEWPSLDEIAGFKPWNKRPAPDSPRTGDEGTEAVKPDPIRLMKEALFACLSEGSHDRDYGGVLVAGGKKAWLRFSVVDAETSAALAARPAAPEAQGAETPWKPISTAPRNDKLVMLGWWCDVGGEPRWIAVAGWYEAGPADRCWYAAYDEERVEPTHWQPLDRLPAPPSSSGQRGR